MIFNIIQSNKQLFYDLKLFVQFQTNISLLIIYELRNHFKDQCTPINLKKHNNTLTNKKPKNNFWTSFIEVEKKCKSFI